METRTVDQIQADDIAARRAELVEVPEDLTDHPEWAAYAERVAPKVADRLADLRTVGLID